MKGANRFRRRARRGLGPVPPAKGDPALTMRLIDTHAHLTDRRFLEDLDDVIRRAESAGVERMVVCGYDIDSSREAVELASRRESVYATVGIHPHDSKNFDQNAPRILTELSRSAKVIAIGEIGLDYHYDFSPRADQLRAFAAQAELAADIGLPIVVHSRESDEDAMAVLDSVSLIHGCVLHYFSGYEDFATRALDRGFYIGFDGPLTYKNAARAQGVARMCPLDRILIETDCPYLTPVPFRGKRNEPAYVRLVAEELSRIRGVSVEEVAEATTRNALRLFSRLKGQEIQ